MIHTSRRFQERIECVNVMESEDLGVIKAKINELKAPLTGHVGCRIPSVVRSEEAAGGAEETDGEVAANSR